MATAAINLDLHRQARRRQQTTPAIGEEITFADIEELCAFVAHVIVSSKMKYVRLAEKAGCCPATISKLAAGETHLPRASTVLNILQALGYQLVAKGGTHE